MKKLFSLALVLCLVALSACGGGGSLPEGMDKATVETHAKEIITALHAGDFDRVVELYDGAAKYGLEVPTAETWGTVSDALDEQLQLGEFEKFTTTSYATVEDEVFGECGVVILGTQYSKKTISWRVSFDKDMECIGVVA